jgi:hypothetical protein
MSFAILKTVTGNRFESLGTYLVPRLHLVVSYTRGGTSDITGEPCERGYCISVQHDCWADEGFRSFIVDGKGDPAESLLLSDSFSQKTLDNLIWQVRKGIHDAIVASLYAEAIASRPQYGWARKILPLEEPVVASVRFDGNVTDDFF